MSRPQRILILVTHLLGSGHLSRALTLGRAFAAAGHETVVVSGGMPVPQLNAEGVRLVQLPPLRSDGTDFTRLLTETGTVADAAVYADRQARIVSEIAQLAPDVLITELFPFGRRSLRAEFRAALEAAHGDARIYASVRDILAPPSKPRKIAFADDMIAEFYDGVLVHSDAGVAPLELSWPVSTALAPKLMYTGFAAPELPAPSDAALGRVLVSAGGGSVGAQLYAAALEAAAQDDRIWHLLVGGHDAQTRVAALQAQAPDNVVVEPARPDFRALLQGAAVSVSLCGYNTAMDVLQSGVPAVMVAFDDGGEVEQSLRAKALGRLPQIAALQLSTVTAEQLLHAVQHVAQEQASRATGFGFDGATQTVRLVTEPAYVG